jgi:hypothetical protein
MKKWECFWRAIQLSFFPHGWLRINRRKIWPGALLEPRYGAMRDEWPWQALGRP